MERILIYPKDIAKLTGVSANTARRRHAKILEHYKRTKEQGLTIKDYCEYCGFDEAAVEKRIEANKHKPYN